MSSPMQPAPEKPREPAKVAGKRTVSPRQRRATVTINPLFKLLIWVNSALCLVTFAGLVILALFAPNPMTKAQEQLAAACDTVFKMTAGAFIGLLGGRAAAPERTSASKSH